MTKRLNELDSYALEDEDGKRLDTFRTKGGALFLIPYYRKQGFIDPVVIDIRDEKIAEDSSK